MEATFGVLVGEGRLLEALRVLFADESETAVEEFIDAAEEEPRLTGICTLLALDKAQQDPSDRWLLKLEAALHRAGLGEDSQRVGALLEDSGPVTKNAIDAIIAGERLTEEVRHSIVAELLAREPPTAAEIEARQECLRSLRHRLGGRVQGGGDAAR